MDTFLDGLAHARIYPYQGKDNILAIVQQELAHSSDSEYVDFSHVDTTAFADLAREANDDIIPTMIKDYSRLQNLLVIKVTASGSHEQLYNRLAQLINNQVLLMGLDGQLRQMGRRSDKWPTVAIEVGYSESLPKLQADAKFWITESGGDVEIVLVATTDRSERRIILQKWEPKSSASQGQVVAGLTRDITISKRVVDKKGPLVVEFEKLFLLPANQAPEADIVIDSDLLMDMAEQVWETQHP